MAKVKKHLFSSCTVAFLSITTSLILPTHAGLFSADEPDVLVNPEVTSWGNWGEEWDSCQSGTYARAFVLKNDPYKEHVDNTGLNGIRLLCAAPGNSNYAMAINNSAGDNGEWGDKFDCGALITGFQLKSVANKGMSRTISKETDDLGAVNFKAFCGVSGKSIEGDGKIEDGNWTEAQHCKIGQAICGIMTQIDLGSTFRNDLTGLNNIKIKCCTVPNPNSICIPTDDWDLISMCDNISGNETRQCNYTQYRGTGREPNEMYTGKHLPEVLALREIGYTDDISPLSVNFQQNLNNPRLGAGILWRLETNPVTWSPVTSKNVSYEVPPGISVWQYQVVGHCGTMVVLSSQFRTSGVNSTDSYRDNKYWNDI